MPLVPRDGARVVRRSRDRGATEQRLRVGESRPRGAPRRGPRVHVVRAGDDRVRRLADDRLSHAGVEAVLRWDVFPAVLEVGPPRLRGTGDGNRPCVEGGTPARQRSGWAADRAAAVGDVRRRRGKRGRGRRGVGQGRRAVSDGVRPPACRIRGRTEVPTAIGAAVPAARARSEESAAAAVHGHGDAPRDGARRHARPCWWRLSPLLGGRRMARAALREDAVRPGTAGAGVSRSRAGDG